MSEASDCNRYAFSIVEEQTQEESLVLGDGMSRMNSFPVSLRGPAERALNPDNSYNHQEQRTSPTVEQQSLHEDVEMKSSGSSANDSNGHYSNGNDSHGNESSGSSQGIGKDSALLESSESNKSSNSQSPSPPSSSNAFSLLSASSEPDNPSTSGCSSEQSAKAKTQKELMKTLKELKMHLPPEKRSKGKSSTLSSLKYALRCVKQVKANEDYYQLLMTNDSQPSKLDVSSYTIEEIDNITSEYTFKNTDIFAVAVSLITGKIVYISDQAASILNCKREVFKNTKFIEFLIPQDISVFYSFTTPYRLPSWSMCTGAESTPPDCMQEKSFFCRISGGRERDGDIQYYPFRMTPYLMKVQDAEHAEDQFCCLLLAERVHSGYEAPRIPPDKRIFTTTHTPGCVFQDVDERAVPLLGYLPQDLIGTPILLHLHPSDRPVMLSIHKKILQYAGQPFDHSAIRFCARNGEYVTIDTSWSSFVNPWSRKVSFIIGRHKVRTAPVNEDVFAAPALTEGKIIDSDIQELTEQIHRLLLQPVHNNGSSGYGSLGSNGSHEHLMSVASSSESNGNLNDDSQKTKPRTFQEICKGVHMLKNQGQQVFVESRSKSELKKDDFSGEAHKDLNLKAKDSLVSTGKEGTSSSAEKNLANEEISCKEQPVYSYQQISCLDSVIRYLESCNIPATVKRKCQSSSNTASSISDDDKMKTASDPMQITQEETLILADKLDPEFVKAPNKDPGGGVVGPSLAPLALPSKAESVVSFTSLCSYSSTIVHVGDKKPQPESEIIEECPSATEQMESQQLPAAAPVSQEKEAFKVLGLTKEVLAAHTQKEEQTFLNKFKELRGIRMFKSPCSFYLQERHKGQYREGLRTPKQGVHGAVPVFKKSGRNKKTKSKRVKQHESSDSTTSQKLQPPQRTPLMSLNHTSWSPSDTSQSSFPAVPFLPVMPAYSVPVFPAPGTGPPGAAAPPVKDPLAPGFRDGQNGQDIHMPMQQPAYSAPIVTPMVAFVLPNYVFPQVNNFGQPIQPFFTGQPTFQTQTSFPTQPAFPVQPQFPVQNAFLNQSQFPGPSFNFGTVAETEKSPAPDQRDGLSRSSTPLSPGARDHASPPLFQSRCSSPLQLNLLQLEETPKSVERQEIGTSGPLGDRRASISTRADASKDTDLVVSLGECQNSDTHSSSSDFLDILMQEDSQSGTGSAASGSGGSAASGSLGSGSNGLSGSATGSSQTSNTSKYFGSIDSSENEHKPKLRSDLEEEQSKHFIKYVLQDPMWLLMANTDESVMMTYQLPSREIDTVLKQDKEKLKQMQKSQPKFTEEQKKELVEVHPWIKKSGLPKAIDIKECVCCGSSQPNGPSPFDVEIHDVELGVVEPTEEGSLRTLACTSNELENHDS
ncbi:period circadian protein homolog 2 [Polypterus senegalus]|uniref:period circadian protein homolog 2 n=1 Tax=Polypterus senegalus TaxID=55291 RepID=UPI00196526E0|nr:period circadian protein homolog 2 [Polypterus senegalus]